MEPSQLLDVLANHGLLDLVLLHCREYQVDELKLLSRSRSPRVCNARFRLWEKLRRRGFSYPEIGELFDRDHTTVMAGLRTLEPLRLRVEA